jgi:DNA polymerase-3 subunit epsilon
MPGLLQKLIDWRRGITLGPDTEAALERGRFAVVDMELTGLNCRKDSIVSIGCLKMTGTRIDVGDFFYEVVSPDSELTAESVVVHGIMPSDTVGQPLVRKTLERLIAFTSGCVLVGHFFSLDLGFLKREVRKIYGLPLRTPALDTLAVYEWILQHSEGIYRHCATPDDRRDLFSLAAKYRIEVSGAHNALMDAYVTAQLFQRFLCVLPELGVKSVKDLLRIGRP